MPYRDRLRAAKYTAPSGASFDLLFTDLERSGGKKAAVHELPQQDIADVQDLGNTAEKFPMSTYFTGDTFDLEADDFWNALSERGPGTLQHPRYGDIPVLPLTWSQSEKWVENLGRADFSIDFIRVPDGIVFPITSVSISESVSSETDDAIESAIVGATDEFAPESAADVEAVKVQVTTFLDDWTKAFAEITAASESIQAAANKAVSDITTQLDALIAAPASLFRSLANLAKLPASVVSKVAGKVDSYKSQITASALSVPESYAQAVTQVQILFYSFAGSSVASTVGTITRRSEAVQSSDAMTETSSAVLTAIEAAEAAIPGFRADPVIVQSLVDAASKARQSILDRVFTLKAERRVVMATDRNPLEVLASFYSDALTDIDQALIDLIDTNGLKGDEILLIPAGRELVYYV